MNVCYLTYPTQMQDLSNEDTQYSLAIGFFDGVHLGHRAVIDEAKRQAEKRKVKLAVMTFDPHPSLVLGGRNEEVFYITPLDQKLALLKELGVDCVFVGRFTSDFAKLSPEEFVKAFIIPLNVVHVTAGFDFSFGAFGKGTMEDMKVLGAGCFTTSVISKKSDSVEKISSTRIRSELKQGNMEEVMSLLGRPFQIPGVVIHGDKRGRTIGFPTANIQAAEGSFIPATGVYAVKIYVQGKWYEGVCNVGYKPTFKDPSEKKMSIEVHIFNFNHSIYGEEVKVDWYKYLRNEQKFNGIEALVKQIEADKQAALAYFEQKE